MRSRTTICATVAIVLLVTLMAHSARQTPVVRAVDEKVLRECTGVYRWAPNAFVYLQMWEEFSGFGKPKLVAFDESGETRTLYPTDRDQFFSGPGVAVPASIESRIEFQRDGTGKITSLTWQREGAPPRIARRVEIEKHEDVRFSSGDVKLTGTLISPADGKRHPAIILVHGSGAENREYMLPWARFLIRRGIAVLGYDKRGVGGSTGDWNTASFDDLAGDVVAAFEYLKTRADIDPGNIGLLGISQAGWVMPLAAVRAKDIAFLISVSGAGVPGAETTIDQTKNELSALGTPPQVVEEVVGLLTLQYHYARTGQGWDEYAAARAKVSAKMGGPAPPTIPGTQGRSVLAVHPADLLLRSWSDASSAEGASVGNLRGARQQHRGRQEQSCLGGGPQNGRQQRLHAAHPAKGESRSVRGEGRKQRRGTVVAAIRADLFHDRSGLAREADPRRRHATVVPGSTPAKRARMIAA